ncbi:MAG TPA: OmpA family protein [Saprospiraceae bacterium]|nr:OmpA family protein [Saprospiraceae bacterium]
MIKLKILLILGTIFMYFMPAWSQVDSSKVTISRFDKVSTDARVNDIYIDNKNVIWLATNKGLIETVGDGSKVNNYFHNTEMVSITSERKDNIWVASAKAIYNFQTKVSYGLPHDGVTITGITYLDGSVWIGTNNGLYQFVVATSKFKVFDTENSKLASNKINFIQADKNRILWIGTDAGYVRIDGSKWEVQDKKMTMLATSENYEGQWIISNKDMFLLNHYNRLFSVKLDESQYKGKINKFVLDSKGRIYIASDILARYNPYNEQIINYSEDAATLSKAAISIACDKNDNIWIGTNGAGFYKLLFGDVVAEQVNANIIVENNIGCQGSKNGSIKVTVSGGTRPYSYKWSISGTSGTTASGLGAGLYEVTVTDKSQNTSVASITLTDPEPVQIDLVSNNRVTNPENPDGSVYVNITGGAGGYTYNWSNGTKNQNLMNARSGPYTLTVTDKNGCLASSTFHIMREKFIPDLDAKKVIVGQKLRINELNFVSDSSSITQDNYDILNEVYDFLVANPGIIIEIGGHTNTIPPHEYCDQLSTARAKNVAEYLYSRGIPKSRITYKGYGKREPLTDSTSAQGRQKNQRVEIKILQI